MKDYRDDFDKFGLSGDFDLDDDILDDDSFYEDRLNDLYDEISQLKKEISGNAGSRDLYGEINRLRDDIRRSQSSQDMRSEMSRLKEQMEKENYLLEEIKRLKERLDRTSDARKSVQLHSDEAEAPVQSGSVRADVAKLLMQSNEILKAVDVGDDSVKAKLCFISEKLSELKENAGGNGKGGQSFNASDDIFGILVNEVSALREDVLSNPTITKDQSGILVYKVDAVFDEIIRLKNAVDEVNGGKLPASEVLEAIHAKLEKLENGDNSDVAAEMMKLREELKTAKIIEQNEVLKEIETLRGDIDKIKVYKFSAENENGENMPTYGEVNMILSEIVSLRDEIQAYKDEMVTGESADKASGISQNEGFEVLFDEMTEVKNSVEELKDVVSRRTTLVAADASAVSDTVGAGGLNVVLDEIITLKGAVSEIRREMDQSKADRNEIKELLKALAQKKDEPSDALKSLFEEMSAMREQLNNLQVAAVGADAIAATADMPAIYGEIHDIKSHIAMLGDPADAEDENDIYTQVSQIREELRRMKDEPDLTVLNEVLVLRAEYQAFKDAVNEAEERAQRDRDEIRNPGASAEVLDEIKLLRDQLFAISMASVSDGDENAYESYNNILLEELSGLRIEFDEYKKSDSALQILSEIDSLRDAILASGMNEEVRAQLSVLKDEIDDFKNSGSGNTDMIINSVEAAKKAILSADVSEQLKTRLDGVKEDIEAAKNAILSADISEQLKTRLDGVKEDIESLRKLDRFEEIIAQLDAVKNADKTDAVIAQIDSAKETILASGINEELKERLTAIKDELDEIKNADNTAALTQKINEAKEMILASDLSKELKEKLIKLQDDVDVLKDSTPADEIKAAVLEQIRIIKKEIEDRRRADELTVSFMSDMLKLLERQSDYLFNGPEPAAKTKMELLRDEVKTNISAQSAPSKEDIDEISKTIDDLKQDLSNIADLVKEDK